MKKTAGGGSWVAWGCWGGGVGEGPGGEKAPAGASTAAAVGKTDSAPAGADTAAAVGKYR